MRITLLALIAATACAACSREDPTMPPPTAPTATLRVGGADTRPTVVISAPTGDVVVHVEVVATEASIERGLMYRENLPPDDGMLFLMGRDYHWTFWMHNTLIPLDMIFITQDMKVLGIVERAEPRTDSLRAVDGESRYVLEVNGGWNELHKIPNGATVKFVGVGAH